MATPKKRMSQTRTGTRRSQIHQSLPTLTICQNCRSSMLAHTACAVCGQYQSRPVIDVEKRTRTRQAKSASEAESAS